MKNFVRSALFGLAALLLVHFTGVYTGIVLIISKLSIGASVLLGIPGVILMVLLQFVL